MSDFDKEAEREKLREKYERDEEKRQTTERMSELLLKGATMTNAHCDNCGDPIFRYDGQEFCPTCQRAVDRGDGESANGSGSGGIEVTKPGETQVQFGGETVDEAADGRAADGQAADDQAADSEPAAGEQIKGQPDEGRPAEGQPAESRAGEPAAGGTGAADGAASTPGRSDGRRESVPGVEPAGGDTSAPVEVGDVSATDDAPAADTDAAPGADADDIAATEQLLAATARQFARQAHDADRPRDAVEHLEAAREAAAALSELRSR